MAELKFPKFVKECRYKASRLHVGAKVGFRNEEWTIVSHNKVICILENAKHKYQIDLVLEDRELVYLGE